LPRSRKHQSMVTRSEILVRGIVQGVGFRPFVYTQASRRDLRGRVRNNTSGVLIEVEGDHGDIEQFVSDLKSNAPPLSNIESVECNHYLTPAEYSDFVILESAHEPHRGEQLVPISSDVATCEDCLRELFDAEDRRYRYPFINCTNCGPRFTIIEDIPYDRGRTTMRDFQMCGECSAEYEDPLDRRFHAEPIACPKCGPQVRLSEPPALAGGLMDQASDNDERPPAYAGGSDKRPPAYAGGSDKADDAVAAARDLLIQGKILAIKGIGGFHLACDALNAEAVERLRARKYREDKPFAMMAASVAWIREHCIISREEEELLLSERRPIVLLERRPDCGIARAVAPGVNVLGFMLPYSALHHLLLQDLKQPLVMMPRHKSDSARSRITSYCTTAGFTCAATIR
jgi:hydrogenase maturation protein HypF